MKPIIASDITRLETVFGLFFKPRTGAEYKIVYYKSVFYVVYGEFLSDALERFNRDRNYHQLMQMADYAFRVDTDGTLIILKTRETMETTIRYLRFVGYNAVEDDHSCRVVGE